MSLFVKFFVILPEYDINLFILYQFLLSFITRKWLFRVFVTACAKLCGKMDVKTFGLRKFSCLGVIFLE